MQRHYIQTLYGIEEVVTFYEYGDQTMAKGSIQLSSGARIHIQAKGLKLGANDKIRTPAEIASILSKGDRRRLRKGLDRMGRRDLTVQTL